MERTLGACAGCEEIVVVGVVDGEVVPVGQAACANCGGTEFLVAEGSQRGDAADDV